MGCDFINIKQPYVKYVEKRSAKSKTLKNCIWAFVVGGLICVLGQGLHDFYMSLEIHEETVDILVPVTLVFIAALTTGLDWFDKLAKHAGAGTLVPITGFANAVVSPAVDTKTEGYILGLGAKIFIIAGPVILYGVLTSAIFGVIIWTLSLFDIMI
ncbi:MAG: stage V sporulation protein AC [Eubacteriales bacterium]